MARIDTLENFLTDVADSIREKTGNTEPIACEDFDTEIENIQTGGSFKINDCSNLFQNGYRLEEFETFLPVINGTLKANGMFSGVTNKPTGFNDLLAQFDTSNITEMVDMFRNKTGNGGLDLSNFNTSNVTTMAYMFYGSVSDRTSIQSLNLDFSSFNTEKVTNMSYMFANNQFSGFLDLSNFNTQNDKAVDMSYMFYNNYYLTRISLGALRPNTLASFLNMSINYTSSFTVDVSKFDTSQCTSLQLAFSHPKLATLDISNFDTQNVTNMAQLFYSCGNLETITINPNKFVTSNVTVMNFMFSGCTVLTAFNFSNFNTSNVTAMVSMFANCRTITKLDLSSFTSEKLTQTGNMFQNCYKLEEIDLSNFDFTTKITSFGNMFSNCGTQTSDGLTKVYVKDTDAQNWILTKSNGKPSTWSTANVIVAGSSDDLRGSE